VKYRLLTCAWMLVAASVCHAQPAAPADPLTAAREAYNAARYDDAAALFLRAVQADPKNAGLYRDLARARAWTRDSTGAVVAYRLYLSLATNAEDRPKVEAELGLALRKAQENPPEGPPAVPAATLNMALERAGAGDVAGAIALLKHALSLGYIGPGLADARGTLLAALERDVEASLAAFDDPARTSDPTRLMALASTAKAALDEPALGLATPGAQRAAAMGQGLAAVREGRDAAALNLLVDHAGSDPRLRFIVAVALYRVGRADEAAQSLSVLDQADPRVAALRALAERAAGRDPRPHAARALGL